MSRRHVTPLNLRSAPATHVRISPKLAAEFLRIGWRAASGGAGGQLAAHPPWRRDVLWLGAKSHSTTSLRRDRRRAERLKNPDAILTRSDLAVLGWSRRGVDAIMRACPVIVVPGFSRPVVTVADYRAFLEKHTYQEIGSGLRLRGAGGEAELVKGIHFTPPARGRIIGVSRAFSFRR